MWLILAACVLANALYVSAEFGAVGVRRSRVRRMSEDGHASARRLLPFIENSAELVRYVSASQIGITLAGLSFGAYEKAHFHEPLTALFAARLSLDPAAARSAADLAVLAGL